MIAKIKELKLHSYDSTVFDIEIESQGVTMVTLPCATREDARELLAAIKKHTIMFIKVEESK